MLLLPSGSWGEWITWSEGALLPQAQSFDIMLVIRDGCVGGLRVDIKDPTLHVTGTVHGNMSGIVSESSHIRFAIGSNLALEAPFQNGSFSYEIPVGDLLPSSGRTPTWHRYKVPMVFRWRRRICDYDY